MIPTTTAAVKKIETDIDTYNKYVEQKLWQPTGEVKWHKNHAGIVDAMVSVKGRKSMVPASIIIYGYFALPIR